MKALFLLLVRYKNEVCEVVLTCFLSLTSTTNWLLCLPRLYLNLNVVLLWIFFFFGADKLYPDTGLGSSRLIVIALAHAFSFFAAVASSLNVSGGHINPAVTFGSLVGGRISVVRAIYYWVAQLFGSVLASLLLRLATDGLVITSK